MRGSENITRRSLVIGSAAAAAVGLSASPAHAIVKSRRVDFAAWQPVDGASSVAMSPVRVVVHIAATSSRDIYGPQKGSDGSYAHFYNRRTGRPLQHQRLDRVAPAQLDANGSSISVEHQGVEGQAMTSEQMTNLAKIFAWSHVFCGVPNRIATVRPDGNGGYNVDLHGLAWHRLGISGNFGSYARGDRKTWSRAQTGRVWSSSSGKTCPTDAFIDQIPEVYRRAQTWIELYRNPPPPA